MSELTQILMRLIIILLSVQGSLGISRMTSRTDPVVDTRLGQIRGLTSEDGLISMFLGIPYAVVDETNPFEPSVPHAGFDEVFNAIDDSIFCPQMKYGEPIGQVQCLNLNIFVPTAAAESLPVMVYIHGGAFIEGSGTNIMGTPNFLVEKGVIVVTINYRVGIYGFMCTDSTKVPGNIGLKDQFIALRWIKNNIEDFGGDANKITIFGESAGAMSVHFHLLSSYEVLYNRAIIQSGAAGSPWTVVHVNNEVPIRIAELLGFVTQDVEEAIDFIARADVHEAILAGSVIRSTSQYSIEPLTKACVEREFVGIERFITQNPNVADLNDKLRNVDIMIGYASQELIFQHHSQEDEFYDNYSFKGLLDFGFDVSDFEEMVNIMRQFYIGDENTSKGLENEITSFASDFLFNHPTERAIRMFLQSGASVVYHYVFSYVGERSTVTINNSTLVGASHADDINYLYDTTTLVNPETKTDDDQLMIDRMTTLWTNFAKYGDPTPQTSDLLPVKWERVTEEIEHYLDIDKDLRIRTRPFHDRLAFWDLFYELNDRYAMWYMDWK